MKFLARRPGIFVALGANLPGPGGTTPLQTCQAALSALAAAGIRVAAQSSWYRTEPVGEPGQPWFVNAVVEVATGLGPEALLAALHRIEARFGRLRERHWAARTLDLDLIDYRGMVRDAATGPILPHPRMAERRFVLEPLAEIAPDWRLPPDGPGVARLLAALPGRPQVVRLPQAPDILADRRQDD